MCAVEIQNAEYRTERMADRKSVDFFWNVTRKVPQVRSRDFNNTMRGVVLAAQKISYETGCSERSARVLSTGAKCE